MDMDISMDIHSKSVDMDMDMDGKIHIHGNPAYRKLPSLFLMVPSLTPYDLPFPQNGGFHIPFPKIGECPYRRNG